MMVLVLISMLLILPVKSQLSVTWNGSTISGPVLIYFDEILIDNYTTAEIGNVSRPGALVCRSEERARVSWHFPSGLIVSDAPRNDSRTIIQTRTGVGVTPSVSQLSKTRNFTSNDTEQNGVWHCRLNAIGERDVLGATYDDQISVGIFTSRDDGAIMIELVNISSASFESTPPTFTLHADTSGGPPTNYTWRRDNQPITHGDQYKISIAVNGRNETEYEESRYRSTLTVTGHLPGFYEYFATNRATRTMLTGNYTIEGGDPSNLRAVQNSLRSVLVSWTEPSSPPAMGYRVRVQPGEVNIAISSSPATVDLLPGVVYDISVTALSQHFPSQQVGPVQVEVRVSVGKVVVTTLSATSVNVSWERLMIPDVVGYTVYYKPADSTGNQAELSKSVTSLKSSAVIDDLATDVQVYQVQVAVVAEQNGTTITGQRSDRTYLFSAHVGKVLVTTLSLTAVNVSWERLMIPDLVGYTVYYKPTDSTGIQTELSKSVSSLESSVVIDDLVTNVMYQFQLAVVLKLNRATITGQRFNTTFHVLLSAHVEIVAVTALSSTSVNVSWERLMMPDVVGYTVYYKPISTAGIQIERLLTVSSLESSVVIGGLATGVEYQFQMAVVVEMNGRAITGQRSDKRVYPLFISVTDSQEQTAVFSGTFRLIVIGGTVGFILITITITCAVFVVNRATNRRVAQNSENNRPSSSTSYDFYDGDDDEDDDDDDEDDYDDYDEDEDDEDEVDSMEQEMAFNLLMSELDQYLTENSVFCG